MKEINCFKCGRLNSSEAKSCFFCDTNLEEHIHKNNGEILKNNFNKEPSKEIKRQVVTPAEWEAHGKPLKRNRENLHSRELIRVERKLSYLTKQNIKSNLKLIFILLPICGLITLIVLFILFLNYIGRL